jgi:hypothetical protein
MYNQRIIVPKIMIVIDPVPSFEASDITVL